MTIAFLGAIALKLGLYLVLGAAFVVVAWPVHQRIGVRGLVLLSVVASLIYGYVRYRIVCAQPLTCDVVGPGWAFHYFVRNAPVYAAMGAVMFGAASVTVAVTRGRNPDSPTRFRVVTLGGLTFVVAWLLSALLVNALTLPAY